MFSEELKVRKRRAHKWNRTNPMTQFGFESNFFSDLFVQIDIWEEKLI